MNVEIIDSHQHFWQVGRFAYPWMSSDDKTLYHDFLPDDFETVLRENGVAKSVAVQADCSIEETRWLLELSDRNEFIAGVVGWVDLTRENIDEQLFELAENPKFKGVRHLVQDEPEDDWLIKPEVLRGIRTLAKYNLTYDLLVFTRHLKYLPTLVENCPNVRFVIDHLAKPPIADGDISEWKSELEKVSKYPQIFCKLSGLVTEADHQTWTAEDLRPVIETAFEFFGAERLMFGSDYPVCLLAASYKQVLETYRSFLGNFSNDEQTRIMKTNAAGFYNL